MKIYNTLTRQKDELVPLTPGTYKIYCCGPTVYNLIHIGNARPICIFDVLRRYLEHRGNQVIYVQNFTDVDDKLIRRAKEENCTVEEIAQKYIDEFEVDTAGLNVHRATFQPKATENIQEIIDFVKNLEEKGFAYALGGDVYFRVAKDPTYGKLSNQPLDDLEAGARIDVNDEKENPMDFALWKSVKEGEIAWQSPWGPGRPGWHIECSAMAKRYLGDTIDIHCGGQDLIFPHHENEIAQSECSNGVEFARYFMHNGYINIDNKKMSKSTGNFFTVRDVAEQFGYEPIRFMMVSAYYRSSVNYSYDLIEQSQAALQRLYTFRTNLDFWLAKAKTEGESDLLDLLANTSQGFYEGMDNDLNTAEALAAIFELIRLMNTAIEGEIPYTKAHLEQVMQTFDVWMDVLGLLYQKKELNLDEEVEALIAKRKAARADKNFAQADAIRDQLKEMGIVLEDTAQGMKWYRE